MFLRPWLYLSDNMKGRTNVGGGGPQYTLAVNVSVASGSPQGFTITGTNIPTGTTDANGDYIVNVPSKGDYTVTATKTGYESVNKSVTISEAGVTSVSLTAQVGTYSYTSTITHGTASPASATAVPYGTDYSITITGNPSAGYNHPTSVSVTVGGVAIGGSAYTYTASTGKLVIKGEYITGDIVVTATCPARTFSFTTSLTNGTADPSSATLTYGVTKTITLTPSTGYVMPDSVTMTRGGSAYTGFIYDKELGGVQIPGTDITGDMVLTVTFPANVWTYAVDIDESVSDPTNACTYPAGYTNSNWTPCSNDSSGNFVFNEWATSELIKDIQPVYYTGEVNTPFVPIESEGYTKREEELWDGEEFFTEIPAFYYSVSKSGTKISVRASSKTFSGACQYAFLGADGSTVRPNTHIGCFYYTNVSGFGYSVAGETPTVNMALNQYYAGASARGEEFDCMSFQQYLVLQILFLLMFKTRDSQGKFSRGYVNGHSAVTPNELFTYNNDFGMAGKAGVDGHMAFFWVHDLWGNMYQMIASVFTRAGNSYEIYQNLGSMSKQSAWYPTSAWDNTSTYATQANVGTSTGSIGWSSSGYFTNACGTNGAGFLPKQYSSAGSSSTYWPDLGGVGVYSSYAGFLRVGGYYSGGARAGLFYGRVSVSSTYSASNYGSRLSYRGGRS